MTAEAAFKRLLEIVVRLRSDEGCPWDREQSPASLRGALIEESYECIEAIDENESEHIKEELGDIFLLATMLSYMHEQEEKFSISDVLNNISDKLIRRHPHVFGSLEVKDSSEVLDNWAKIKVAQEGRKPKDSILDEVSRSLPALDRSYKLQKKAARAGFDWPHTDGVMGKLKEELAELEEVLAAGEAGGPEKGRERLEEELGDILFSAVNLCRFLGVEPSLALHRTNVKFTGRFKYVEKKMKEKGEEMKAENLGLMDRYWEDAKAAFSKP